MKFLQSESLDLKLQDCNWKFYIEALKDISGENIDIHLERDVTAEDCLYSCIATVKIELRPVDAHTPPYVGRISPKEFSSLHRKWSKHFIDWEQLVNPAKRFIQDDQIRLEVTNNQSG